MKGTRPLTTTRSAGYQYVSPVRNQATRKRDRRRNRQNRIGIDNQKVNYDEPFWRKYVNLCRAKAECYDVSIRALDRALYKYSECDAVFVMTMIADETLFLELKRRGYDLSSL